MVPNHSLLPELRRRRFILAEELREAETALEVARRQRHKVLGNLEEVDRQIAENDFYHPPPRPSL